MATWKEAVEGRANYTVDYRLRRHDGESRWTMARAVPVLDEDGGVREWVGTNTDISNAFAVQTLAAGSSGYGKFSIDAAGVWTYAMNSAHNAFAAGGTYTDSITVATADGTTQVITVSMLGTDDATVITGVATAALTETNAAQNTGGTLVATDPDSSNAFAVQTLAAGSSGYGKFSIDAAGVWTYAMNSAHNAFASGGTYTDSITVATADGPSPR